MKLNQNYKLLFRLAEVLNLEIEELKVLAPLRKQRNVHTRTPLGNFLSDRRRTIHLTQAEVASRIGVSTTFICMVEIGRKPAQSVQQLEEWAKVLECTIPPELIPANLPLVSKRRARRRRTFMRPRKRATKGS